jgi:hypothetical protein
VAAVVSGAVVLVVTVVRFVADDTQGVQLRSTQSVRAVAAVSLVAVAVGVILLAVASRARLRASWLRPLLSVCCLVLAVAAPVALVIWYPAPQQARLVAYDAGSGRVLWRAEIDATQLFSVSAEAGELILIGRVDDRCDYRFVTIRLDAAGGGHLRTSAGGDAGVSGSFGADFLVTGTGPGLLHFDPAAGRVVSDLGWSVKASPDGGPLLAVMTDDVVYLAEQGENHVVCNS